MKRANGINSIDNGLHGFPMLLSNHDRKEKKHPYCSFWYGQLCRIFFTFPNKKNFNMYKKPRHHLNHYLGDFISWNNFQIVSIDNEHCGFLVLSCNHHSDRNKQIPIMLGVIVLAL